MNSFEALEHVGLRWPRSGKLSCPLHKDRTPSLQLYQDSFYCFSCGRNGDGFGLLAVLSGKPVEEVLVQFGSRDRQRASSETLRLVGPQAMEGRVRRAWSEMNATVYRLLHDIFGEFQTEVLVDEIERMGEHLDEVRDLLLPRDPEAERPPIREALEIIATSRQEVLEYLATRNLKLFNERMETT